MDLDGTPAPGANGTHDTSGVAVGATVARAQAPQAGRAAQDATQAASPVVDVHTHMFSRRWSETLRAAGDANVRVASAPQGDAISYRWSGIGVLGPEIYDWDRRIREMDGAGVEIALIGLTAPNVYWGTRAISARAAHEINDDFAAAQKRYDGRIRWLASLPWDHVDDALAELRRAREAGAVGVCTLTNILGRPLTHAHYEPIWREIEAMRLPSFIHPTLPFDDGMGLSQYDLANAVGFTSETTLCFARMIMDGFLDRFPRLDMIACHGGGALPYLATRIDRCWDKMLPVKHIKDAPSTYLGRLYFDSIVYDQPTLEYLVRCVGAQRMLYGSDYPFSLADLSGMLGRVDALPAAERAAIRSGNARRLFNL